MNDTITQRIAVHKTKIIALLIVIAIFSLFHVKQPPRATGITRTLNAPVHAEIIPDEPTPLGIDVPEEEYLAMAVDMFNMINVYRAENGLNPLVWSVQMYADAQVRVQESMVSFSHTRPNGEPWWTVDRQFNYGECLACRYADNTRALDGWKTSPSHNALLLNKSYPTAAVALKFDQYGYLYWALEFGIG